MMPPLDTNRMFKESLAAASEAQVEAIGVRPDGSGTERLGGSLLHEPLGIDDLSDATKVPRVEVKDGAVSAEFALARSNGGGFYYTVEFDEGSTDPTDASCVIVEVDKEGKVIKSKEHHDLRMAQQLGAAANREVALMFNDPRQGAIRLAQVPALLEK